MFTLLSAAGHADQLLRNPYHNLTRVDPPQSRRKTNIPLVLPSRHGWGEAKNRRAARGKRSTSFIFHRHGREIVKRNIGFDAASARKAAAR
jgi:hypothetical protein